MTAPPSDLTPTERRAFRKLCKSLASRGIDVGGRLHLAADFIRSEARVAALRADERAAKGAGKTPVVRALNVALSERRRLHAALSAGARAPVASSEAPGGGEESEAAAAWRALYYRGIGDEASLEKKYGPPGWSPLLYRTHEEELEAAHEIHRHRRWSRDEPRAPTKAK